MNDKLATVNTLSKRKYNIFKFTFYEFILTFRQLFTPWVRIHYWIRMKANADLRSRLGSALGKICWILICRKRRQIHNPDPHSLFYHLRFFFQWGSWSGSTPGYQKMVKKQLVYISELHKLCYHHQHSTILSCFSH